MTLSEAPFDSPWIGAIDIFDDSAPVMGIHDYLVIFPPASNQTLYEDLLQKANDKSVKASYEKFVTNDALLPPQAIGVAYRKSALVFPDHFKDSRLEPNIIYYPGQGEPPQILSKITKENRDELMKQDNAERVQISFK